jgi:hypothetical protein
LFALSERDRQDRLTDVIHDFDHEGIPLIGGQIAPSGNNISKDVSDFQRCSTSSSNIRQVNNPRILDATAVVPNKEAILGHAQVLADGAEPVLRP